MADTPQPWYTIQLNMAGCSYDVRVNDGPLYENARGLPLVVEIPANRWIRNGKNEISFHLRPVPGKTSLDNDCRCSAIVYQREKGAERETRTEVARLEYPGSAPVRREGDATIVAAPFMAQVPFGLFRWFNSPEIPNNEGSRLGLVSELERLHALFAAKNIDDILAAVAEREQEEAASMYEAVRAKVEDTRGGYLRLFDEAEYTLQSLRVGKARLRLFGNGRLARLDMTNGQSPLYYLTAEGGTAAYSAFVFRVETGRWVVAR